MLSGGSDAAIIPIGKTVTISNHFNFLLSKEKTDFVTVMLLFIIHHM